ncbi:MAG: DctP family TRAP transporter solute-binding subunit [Deltaproteobacteria bacterium]|jgi:C4-dicarboxylate-binding protein DctP|nr:DctP family TRAP transporter solute-binding subunit [Deltaproteobacteria bacterium]
MKSKLFSTLVLIAVIILAPSAAGMAATVIKLAHSSPAANDRLEDGCLIFKKYVEEKSGGAIKVDTFPASQLGAEREQLEGVQMGSIEMAALSGGPFPAIFPDIMVFDVPFLFSSEEVAYEIMDGPIGKSLADKLLKTTGIRLLAYGENGFRNFTTNKLVQTPDDMKGMKIRVMENPAYMQLVRELGAIPTPLPFSEIYTALSQGVADGQENAASLTESARFYEVQKHMVIDRHTFGPYLYIMNDAFYNSLSPVHRKIVDEGAVLMAGEERRMNREQTESGIKRMTQAGLKVNSLTQEQFSQFRAKTQPAVIAIVKKQVDPKTVDAFLQAVTEAEAGRR